MYSPEHRISVIILDAYSGDFEAASPEKASVTNRQPETKHSKSITAELSVKSPSSVKTKESVNALSDNDDNYSDLADEVYIYSYIYSDLNISVYIYRTTQ